MQYVAMFMQPHIYFRLATYSIGNNEAPRKTVPLEDNNIIFIKDQSFQVWYQS